MLTKCGRLPELGPGTFYRFVEIDQPLPDCNQRDGCGDALQDGAGVDESVGGVRMGCSPVSPPTDDVDHGLPVGDNAQACSEIARVDRGPLDGLEVHDEDLAQCLPPRSDVPGERKVDGHI